MVFLSILLKWTMPIKWLVFQDFQLFPHLHYLSTYIGKEENFRITGKLGLLYPYQLSGGQNNELHFARALAMKPKVLGYDEPTSALDPALRQQVEEVILDLRKQGMTQIVVTHDMAFAEKLQTIFDGCPVQ